MIESRFDIGHWWGFDEDNVRSLMTHFDPSFVVISCKYNNCLVCVQNLTLKNNSVVVVRICIL